MPSMEGVSRIVWEECFATRPGEKALIICDPEGERLEIGQALLEAGSNICECSLVKMQPTGMAGREPSQEAVKAMQGMDIIIAPTRNSITHTRAMLRARNGGARAATMPGITRDMFLRAVPVDYQEMDRVNGRLIDIVRGGKSITVTSPAGTDLSLDIMPGRKVCNDNGLIRSAGELNNLPAGEVAIAPREGSASGTLVVDMKNGFSPEGRPFRIAIKEGKAISCENKELWETLTGVENGTNVAELGIGTNTGAVASGRTLEDEKIRGTAHVAFGTSASLGGAVQTSIHLDFVFSRPTIEVDGKVIIKQGEFLF